MVSVGGLASGLDTNGIISQLIEIERRPIAALERDIAELQQVQGTFTGLSTRFSGLRSAAQGLTISNLDQPSVSVTDESAVAVTATSLATAGRHQISIAQLATASRLASQGFADSDVSPIASSAGTFVVQAGSSGAQISVAVTTSTTMSDLADAINAAAGDVTASIIQDGTNALQARLVLTSAQTGRANDIRVTSNTTNLDLSNSVIEAASSDAGNAGTYTGTLTSSGAYTGADNKTFVVDVLSGGAVGAATYRVSEDGGLTWDDNGGAGYATSSVAGTLGSNTEGVNIDFSAGGTLAVGDRFYVDVSNPQLTAAQDAVFTLDGITQTRSSNTVTDALAGVSIDLQQVTTGSANFSISVDDERVVTAVQDFVEAYNDLFEEIRGQQTFDEETLEAGLLLGDRTANTILSEMRRTLSRVVRGTGPYDSLASLGIISSRTGGLSVDTENLRAALSSDRSGVLSVLASSEQTSNAQLLVTSKPSETNDGTYAVLVTTAPEFARVTAGGAQTDALGATETLSFQYSANQTDTTPTTSNFSVTLQAGDTLNTVVERLNSAFATQGVRLRAFSDSNTLNIESTEYGADMSFSVVSDVAGGANTSRIGTTLLADVGVDIAGSINGEASTGTGSRLEVDQGSALSDLSVSYTGTATGAIGTVTLATGVGEAFTDLVEALNTGTESVIGARTSSLQDRIDDIEERIQNREEQVARVQARLEAQFAALEVQLAGLQSQANFLTNQLAQLPSIASGNNS